MVDSVTGFLESVQLFAGLPEHLRAQVADRCRVVRVPAGSWLFRQEDEGHALYIVRTGRVELVREDLGSATTVGVLGPGQALGELALLLGTPRAASARAVRDSELISLERDEVIELLASSRDFASALVTVLGTHLEGGRARAGHAHGRAAVITVVPLDEPAGTAALRDAIPAALAGTATAACLDESVVDGGDRGEDDVVRAYGALLAEQERDNEHVFLFAGRDERWGTFCRRQADRIVAVAPRGRRPPREEAGGLRGADLVLFGSPTGAVPVTSWLEWMEPRGHHLVDAGHQADMARAVRRITRHAVGVVLSRGMAPATAHVGVLAALAEGGVAIDRVGGAGLGALVGGLFALGLIPTAIADTCRAELVGRHPFGDYTLPRFSLAAGRRMRAMLDRLFGEARVEELPTNFFCASADLSSAELVIHRRGSLAHALAASTALPGLLPPVMDGERALVDGSAVNGLPVRVMTGVDEGPVIAVDVLTGEWSGRRRRGRALPGIVDTIGRSASLGGAGAVAEERAAARLVISPDTLGTGPLGFDRFDALVDSGRQAAAAALRDAAELLTR